MGSSGDIRLSAESYLGPRTLGLSVESLRPKDNLNAVPSLDKLRGLEVGGSVRDDAEQACLMRCSIFSATNKGSNFLRHLQVGSSGLGERVDKPVGSPVDRIEASAVPYR